MKRQWYIRLAKLHNVRIDRARAVGLVEIAVVSLGGPVIATAVPNQIVKYFPGYGNTSNAAVAYTLTKVILDGHVMTGLRMELGFRREKMGEIYNK